MEFTFMAGESGGVTLFDALFFASLKDKVSFAEQLRIVADPLNETELDEFYKEPWTALWSKMAASQREATFDSRFVLLLYPQHSEFAVRVQDTSFEPIVEATVWKSFVVSIFVPSGILAASDAALFANRIWDWLPNSTDKKEHSVAEGHTLRVSPGWHRLCVHCLQNKTEIDNGQVLGNFEILDKPAVVLEILPEKAEVKEVPGDDLLQRQLNEMTALFSFPTVENRRESATMTPGRRCYAQVRRAEGEIVSMKLMWSKTASCGYGRMKQPTELILLPDDWILVRLLEDTRSFWRVEWIEKSNPPGIQ